MKETPDALRARYVFGELRLIDLWQLSQLEGLMSLNGIERVTGGAVGDSVEFLGPDGTRFFFPATTIVSMSKDEASFTGEKQYGKGPTYTLTMKRKYDPLPSRE
jgi:hypothetical protein